jgi:hypothetical protein
MTADNKPFFVPSSTGRTLPRAWLAGLPAVAIWPLSRGRGRMQMSLEPQGA